MRPFSRARARQRDFGEVSVRSRLHLSDATFLSVYGGAMTKPSS